MEKFDTVACNTYELIIETSDEQLSELVVGIVESQRQILDLENDKYSDWEILCYHAKFVACEWYRRVHIVLGYRLVNADDFMEYLISDWCEFVYHWYKYSDYECMNRAIMNSYTEYVQQNN